MLWFTKKRVILLSMLFAASVCVIVGILLRQPAPVDYSGVTAPTWQAVLPQGKTIEQLGGWQRVSPKEAAPVFSYADTLESIPLIVSQQSLPPSFRTNSDQQLSELAKNFNATNKLEKNNLTLYLGTSAKGPQSVLMIIDDVLVMIKSEQKIKDAAWLDYAASLRS